VSPDQKSRIIKVARRTGRDVAFLGDGVNDVPQELVGTMFEPFTRAKTVTGIVGSGLGLAISRPLVEAFHERMTYEDEVPHGSRFVVELKAAA